MYLITDELICHLEADWLFIKLHSSESLNRDEPLNVSQNLSGHKVPEMLSIFI